MKLKTVEINGKQYAEIDTAGLPVYVHDDGKEIGFDAPLATKKITELNGEAKNHRLAKEAAEEKLAKFAAIEDPKKAIEALEMLSKIDQKKLLDAGQVDQVKAEITKNFQQQLDEEKQRSQMLEKQLYDSMIGGSFAGSKYIADKIAIPADLLQARCRHSKWKKGGSLLMTLPATKFIPARSLANWRSLMRRWSSLSKITLRKTTS